MMEENERKDILSLLPEELEAELAALGEPRFRAAQIFQWLGRGVRSFEGMTNLSKDLRAKLGEHFFLYEPRVLSKQVSAIDGTISGTYESSRPILPTSCRKPKTVTWDGIIMTARMKAEMNFLPAKS